MNLIRNLLFENVGLKLVALLMALVVYLHVYTDRPWTQTVSFPVVVSNLDDSLAVLSQTPSAVSAELNGTGKQVIRLRLAEPNLTVSLAGVGPGRFQRALTVQDLPMVAQVGLEVSRFPGPQMLELQIDRIGLRDVPVAARIDGALPAGSHWGGEWAASPAFIRVRGPRSVVAKLDSIRLATIKLEAGHDTLKVAAAPTSPLVGCTLDPPVVTLRVPIARAGH